MDEAKLIEKLRLVEALFAGTTTEGEQVAADHARQRILERLRSMEAEDPPVEYRFSMEDMWSRAAAVRTAPTRMRLVSRRTDRSGSVDAKNERRSAAGNSTIPW